MVNSWRHLPERLDEVVAGKVHLLHDVLVAAGRETPIVSACFTSLSSHKRLPLQSHLSPPAAAFKIKCVFYKSKANMSSLALLTAPSSLHAPVELSGLCTGFKKEVSEPGDLLGSSAKTRHASHAERWEDACPVSKTMGKNEECSRSFACFEMTCCNSCALPPRFFEKLYGFTSTSSPHWSPLIKNRTCLLCIRDTHLHPSASGPP